MTKFLDRRFEKMRPYRLGEQPTDREYIKLNSNETTIPPSPLVIQAIEEASKKPIGFYADQDALILREAIAEYYSITTDQIFVGNGADEILSFCFTAYCMDHGLCFPDITYGFYKTFSEAYDLDYNEIPLNEEFQVESSDYHNLDKNIVIPNPNAPTGLRLDLEQIEEILCSNRDRIVMIDEAYVDFETTSCISIIEKHPNLIVIHTMSKSRNIAGLHVGYAVASKEIIEELNCLKNCFNPNSINQVTLEAAVAAVKDKEHLRKSNAQKVAVRNQTQETLENLGFQIIPSYTNFLFVTHPRIQASELEKKLRENGILTRHYKQSRIENYLRITIGTKPQMEKVKKALEEILMYEIV